MVPRDARAVPVRAAAREGELQRARGRLRGHPAARARHEPAALRQRGGDRGARPRSSRSARRTSRASRGGRRCADDVRTTDAQRVRIWLMAARPKTLPVGLAPVLVGHRAGRHRRRLPPAALRRRAARRALHPGRREPLQRLLRRAPRRRHGGPPRPRARDGRRARAAAPGADRDVRDVRRSRSSAASTWSPSPAGSCCSSAPPRSSPACSTPAARGPYGYEGLGELFVFLFFGIVAVAGSFFVQTETLVWEAFALAVPVGLLAAAVLVVNNVRDLETDRRAGKRTLAVRLGRERTRDAVRGDGLRRLPAGAGHVDVRPARRRGCCCRCWRCRSPRRSCARCERAPTARRSTRRSRRPGSSSSSSACCCPPACC